MRAAVLTIILLLIVEAVFVTGWSGVPGADAGPLAAPPRTRVPGASIPTPPPVQRPTLDASSAQATAQALATSAAPLTGQIPGDGQPGPVRLVTGRKVEA